MTLNEFLTKLNFRHNGQWYQYGNDLSYLFANDIAQGNSIPDMNEDMNNIDGKILGYIGRIIYKDDTRPHTEADYRDIANKKLEFYNYLDSLLMLLTARLPKEFSFGVSGAEVVVTIPTTMDLEDTAKSIFSTRMTIFDEIGKSVSTSIKVTNGLREKTKMNL